MPFTWTKKMRPVGATPELEAMTRTAIDAAIDFWSTISDGEQPVYSGNLYFKPQNDTAKAMWAACTKHLPETLTGVERENIIATAVAAAAFVKRHGGGQQGQAELAKHLGDDGTDLPPGPGPAVLAQP